MNVELDNQLFFAVMDGSNFENGNVDVVEALLLYGADPNVHYDGNLPLNIASTQDNLPVVQALLRANADPNMQGGRDRRTALMCAANRLNLPVVQELLRAGANPNIQNVDRTTALMIAARMWTRPAQQKIIKELLRGGANPTLEDWRRETAMAYLPVAQAVEELRQAVDEFTRYHNLPVNVFDYMYGL